MIYIDFNRGARGETQLYKDYDLFKHGDKYFGQTTIPANNPKINNAAPIVLDHTLGGDNGFNMDVHNGAGAPRFLSPQSAATDGEGLAWRGVVEHVIGRVGEMWPICSNNAGNWKSVGLGGHKGRGSAAGMNCCVQTFIVCARLTALTQRLRGTYPRKPHKFFAGQYERWELEMAAKKGLSLGR